MHATALNGGDALLLDLVLRGPPEAGGDLIITYHFPLLITRLLGTWWLRVRAQTRARSGFSLLQGNRSIIARIDCAGATLHYIEIPDTSTLSLPELIVLMPHYSILLFSN